MQEAAPVWDAYDDYEAKVRASNSNEMKRILYDVTKGLLPVRFAAPKIGSPHKSPVPITSQKVVRKPFEKLPAWNENAAFSERFSELLV